MEYDKICGCAIVPTSIPEDNRLKDLEKKGLEKDFIRILFESGRDLIYDVDCPKCHGWGIF